MAEQSSMIVWKRYMLDINLQESSSKRFKSSQEFEESVNESKSSEGTDTSIQSLLNVNEYCLFEIFKYLDLTDLCNIAGACSKLKTMAKEFFSHEYHKTDDNKFFQAMHELLGKLPLIQCRNLLSNFGEFVEQIHVSTEYFEGVKRGQLNPKIFKLLQMIAKYCNNMKYLTVHAFEINKKDSEIWKALFANVLRLNLMCCYGSDVESITLSFCLKLEYLKMDHMVYVNLDMFKNLEAIKLTHCVLDEDELMNLIRVNEKLLKLSIIRCIGITTIDFHEISNLKNLRDLELNQHFFPEEHHFEKTIDKLSEMKSLERLLINCYDCSVASLISKLVVNKNKVNIRYLHLTNGPVSERMIKDIAQMTSIETLKLDELENRHLIHLAKELKSLVYLDVKKTKATGATLQTILLNAQQLTILRIGSPNVHINDDLYDQMVDIVKKRYPTTKLNLVLYDDYYEYNENIITLSSEKIDENAKFLDIGTASLFIIDLFVENLELDFNTGDELGYDTNNDESDENGDDESDENGGDSDDQADE